MTIHFLPSDYLIYALFFACIAAVFYIRSQPHYREPWKKVFQSKVAMSAAVILAMYTLIGLLDSFHFANQKSVLDLLIDGLNQHPEKTYSAPFSVAFYPVSFFLLFAKGFLISTCSFFVIALPVIFYCKHNSSIAWKT